MNLRKITVPTLLTLLWGTVGKRLLSTWYKQWHMLRNCDGNEGPEETMASNTVCVKVVRLTRFSSMSSVGFILKLYIERMNRMFFIIDGEGGGGEEEVWRLKLFENFEIKSLTGERGRNISTNELKIEVAESVTSWEGQKREKSSIAIQKSPNFYPCRKESPKKDNWSDLN